MDQQRAGFDTGLLSEQSDRVLATVPRAQHVCSRALARTRLRFIPHVSLPSIYGTGATQADNRRITGELTGKVTGEKVLFCSVKRLNHVEIFWSEKNCEKYNAFAAEEWGAGRAIGTEISTARKPCSAASSV
jgi:hypothetical protein